MNYQNSSFSATDLSENTILFNELLAETTATVKELLQDLANNADFNNVFQTAFGNDIDTELLKASWTAGEFVFPEIEIVKRSDINNANGAFARDTKKIYLAQEFLLANINNLDAVSDVVLEEYGHFVDSQLNVTDAPGDEGDIFSRLVRGETIGESQLRRLKREDDTAIITLDGNQISIEQALASNSKGFSDLGVYVNGILWGGNYWEVDSTREIDFSFLQGSSALSFDDNFGGFAKTNAYSWRRKYRVRAI